MISDDLRDETQAAMWAGEYDHVREIERQYGHLPGVRIAIYALNECATVYTDEEMLARIAQR